MYIYIIFHSFTVVEFISDKIDHFVRRDDVFIYAHNSGVNDSIHYKETEIYITDDQKCKQIQTGDSIAKDVGEFKTRSLEYYEEYQHCRFPPSFYLKENSTNQWAKKMESAFKYSDDVKILVGYDPIIHMQLLGLEKSEYMEILNNPATAKYDNSVIVIHNEKRVVTVCLVTDETDDSSITTELIKLNTILKAIYFGNLSVISDQFVAILGILVCQNINSRPDLKNYQAINSDNSTFFDYLFITKAERSSAETLVSNNVSNINKDIQNINTKGNS